MGHYCRICGRTRANEKFSGKGHKNHVCRDCSGKSGRKAEKIAINESGFDCETLILSDAIFIQTENTFFADSLTFEVDFENGNAEDEKDEELPS